MEAYTKGNKMMNDKITKAYWNQFPTYKAEIHCPYCHHKHTAIPDDKSFSKWDKFPCKKCKKIMTLGSEG